MNRLNKILLVALLAQLALTVLVWRSSRPEAPQAPQPLLAGFDAGKVTKLVLHAEKGGDSGAAVTPPLELAKRGEAWVVASSFDYPAQPAPILELLGKLGGLTHTGPIASATARAKQLGVADDEYVRKVVATLEGKEVTLLLGKPVGSRQTAARLGGAAEIFAIGGLTPWAVSTNVTSYVATAYAEAPRDQISKVAVTRAGQTIELTKDAGQWKATIDGAPLTLAAGESLDQGVIDEVLGQVSLIELSQVAEAKAVTGAETALVSVWTQALEPAPGAGSASGAAPAAEQSAAPRWVLAAYERDGALAVQRRGATHAVMVEKSRLGTVLELAREKLVKKPSKPSAPTPTQPAGLPVPR